MTARHSWGKKFYFSSLVYIGLSDDEIIKTAKEIVPEKYWKGISVLVNERWEVKTWKYTPPHKL